jgi:hypothetical protein
MTQTQFQVLLGAVRRVEEQVQAIEARLAWEFPTEREMREQLEREVDEILRPGGSLKVFAED